MKNYEHRWVVRIGVIINFYIYIVTLPYSSAGLNKVKIALMIARI